MNPQFQFCNLRKTFRSGDALYYPEQIEIPTGTIVLVTGGSGTGKTTLLNLLSLLEVPDFNPTSKLHYYEGAYQHDFVKIHSEDWMWGIISRGHCTRIRAGFGYLPQQGHLPHVYTIAEHLHLMHAIRGKPGKMDEPALKRALEEVRLEDKEVPMSERLGQSPASLSGGQQQRLILARALYGEPRVIFADEPTTFLDQGLIDFTIGLLVERALAGSTVILVTHEPKRIVEAAQKSPNLPTLYQLQLNPGKLSERETQIELEFQEIPGHD